MAATTEPPISPVTTSRPELTVSAASINSEPVELDSLPISVATARQQGTRAPGPDQLSTAEREKRAELHEERKSDPAVLVDIPQLPGPEELEVLGAMVDAAGVVSESSGK